jgi:threonine dehydrogenase-like Zn-dependent dehydrogenase
VIIFPDVDAHRLNVAKDLGADGVVQVGPGISEADAMSKIEEYFGGRRPNQTIECSGAEASLQLAIRVRFNFFFITNQAISEFTDYRNESRTDPLSCFASTNS